MIKNRLRRAQAWSRLYIFQAGPLLPMPGADSGCLLPLTEAIYALQPSRLPARALGLAYHSDERTSLDHPGKLLFLENTATPANSEIVYQITNGPDSGAGEDLITILDGLTNNQTAADTDIWEIDAAGTSVVAQYVVELPMSANRVRVIYGNKNSTAADIYSRCRISKVTAI